MFHAIEIPHAPIYIHMEIRVKNTSFNYPLISSISISPLQ